jgi:hypothetical protein
MLVFSYAVELDAVDPQSDGYDALLREAIKSYRSRATCSARLGNSTAASRDLKRAGALTAKLKKPDSGSVEGPTATSQVTIRNEWPDAVTLVIAGRSYSVPAGGEKTLPSPSGTFSYEMVAGPHRVTGTIDAGKTYSVKPPPVPAP